MNKISQAYRFSPFDSSTVETFIDRKYVLTKLFLLWQFQFERLYKPFGRSNPLTVSESAIGLSVDFRKAALTETHKAVL
jgi:hypothetical protein